MKNMYNVQYRSRKALFVIMCINIYCTTSVKLSVRFVNIYYQQNVYFRVH